MSNRLSMATIHSVETLHLSSHSNREIARLLKLDRGTVNRIVKRLQAADRRSDRSSFAVSTSDKTPSDVQSKRLDLSEKSEARQASFDEM